MDSALADNKFIQIHFLPQSKLFRAIRLLICTPELYGSNSLQRQWPPSRFVIFSVISRKCRHSISLTRPQPLTFISFPIHHTLTVPTIELYVHIASLQQVHVWKVRLPHFTAADKLKYNILRHVDREISMFPWQQLHCNRVTLFSKLSVPRCYKQDELAVSEWAGWLSYWVSELENRCGSLVVSCCC
jgi:hypothetical protein